MSSLLHPDRDAHHREPLRVVELEDVDLPGFRALLDRDPLVNAVLRARLDAVGSLLPRRMGGAVYGVRDASGDLTAAAFSGGNLLPVGGGPAEWRELAAWLATRRRVCSSIVGRAEAVHAYWRVLERVWGPARLVRADQPLLVLERLTQPVDPSVAVVVVRPEQLDAYLPAAAAMFAEELGIAPREPSGTGEYRRRIAGLIRDRRAFAVFDDHGQVLFKTDIGAVSPHTCQVQGVWTRPDLRGHGLASRSLPHVIAHALDLAPSVSLYVNDFNAPARRVYERLGMYQAATFATVLF